MKKLPLTILALLCVVLAYCIGRVVGIAKQ